MQLLNAFLILALFTTSSLIAEIRVSARFEPARVGAGKTSQYIVEIVETDDGKKPAAERITSLPIPSNGGLTLRNGRTSSTQSTRITNGISEYSNTQQLIIEAVSSTTGSFTIPAYIFE